jgi:nucleoside-diphosphate-sugar epimerase
MVLYNSFGQAGWLDDSPMRSMVELWPGDVRDPDSCARGAQSVDVIFHLAALIAIPYSYQAPRSYIDTNTTGTLNVCAAALSADVSKVVVMSTSEVYGTAVSVPISEDHPLQPQSPYSASKIGADAIARSFQSSFGLPLCIARAFNTYGPRQSRRAFIPAVMSQALAGVDELRVGDLRPTRDLTFVEDTALALALLAEKGPLDGSVVNIGTGIEHSMQEVVDAIQKLAGTTIPVVPDPERMRPPNSEVFRLLADNTRLSNLTGFAPEKTLEEGLERTMDWMRDRPSTRDEDVSTFVV